MEMAFFRKKFDPAMMREMYIDSLELKAKKEAEKKALQKEDVVAPKDEEVITSKKDEVVAPTQQTEEQKKPEIVEEKKVEEVVKNVENDTEVKQNDADKVEDPEQKPQEEKDKDEELVIYLKKEDIEKGEIVEVEKENDKQQEADEGVETDVKEVSDNEWELNLEEKTAQDELFEEINCYINNKYQGKGIKKVKVTECENQQKEDGKQYEKYDVTVSHKEENDEKNSDDFHFIYEKITARKQEGKTVKKEKTTITRRFTVIDGERQIKDEDRFEVKKDYELNK